MNSERKKCLVVLSGGMDSTTLLHHVVETVGDVEEIHAICFNYGQRHKKELKMAHWQSSRCHVPLKMADISAINCLIQGSSLTSDGVDTPHGNYDDENMKDTFVPNRNMILLSLAVGYAASIGATTVYYGAHSGDHAIYPDCRPIFVEKMNAVSMIANYDPIEIKAPFLDKDKGDIVILGEHIGVDYAHTWTCYEGLAEPCGKCGSCVERAEAFEKAGVPDPLVLK